MRAHTQASAHLRQPILLDRQGLIGSYERYHVELFRYAYRLLGDINLAEDCVSETFYRLIKAARDGMGPVENLRAYLYRVAHNWITDYYRSQPLMLVPLEAELHGEAETNPSQLLIEQLERERVRTALLHLPPEQRQVIVLRFVENRSHNEVAAALGKSIQATRTLQHRALLALRQLLVLEEAGFTFSPPGRQRNLPAAVQV